MSNEGLKYRCLVLDHDDTVVNSTATVHYPSFVEYMEKHHGGTEVTLEDYFRYNFDPGVVAMFTEICGMSFSEMEEEEKFWNEYVREHVPKAYGGIREILGEQKRRGGLIAVVSHSFTENIRRDYRENGLPEPDLVFGWECPPGRRKPNPWPLEEIMRRFALRADQLLMLDDLKPGYDMALACGVPFAAAGWANDIPEIERFMRANCGRYFKTVDQFGEWLFG